jgi:tellurite resistance protein TerC
METSIGTPLMWAAFVGFVLLMLALDLGVFHRKSHVVTFKEAAIWSAVWVALALLFGGWVYLEFGTVKGTEYLTGYVIEKSLSVDNIFVFVMIFGSLGIPALYQHRVLFWGILTALILRAVMIFAGAAAIQKFHWVIYIFGGFLVLTGIKMFFARSDSESPEDSKLLKWARRVIPSTTKFDGERFFTRENGKRVATPLFMALILVEFSDVIFAVDSIPAIFAITTDPFIVFTSNIFAILGLRSLFFMLAGLVNRFRYLKVGLAAVLVFVGIKMLIIDYMKIPPGISLAVILSMLGASIWYSLVVTKREGQNASQG